MSTFKSPLKNPKSLNFGFLWHPKQIVYFNILRGKNQGIVIFEVKPKSNSACSSVSDVWDSFRVFCAPKHLDSSISLTMTSTTQMPCLGGSGWLHTRPGSSSIVDLHRKWGCTFTYGPCPFHGFQSFYTVSSLSFSHSLFNPAASTKTSTTREAQARCQIWPPGWVWPALDHTV